MNASQQHEAMIVQLMRDMKDRGPSDPTKDRSPFSNIRGHSKPMAWDANATTCRMWISKLMAYDRMSGKPRVDGCVRWAQTQKEAVTDDAMEIEFGEDTELVKLFSLTMHGDLTMLLEAGTFSEMDALEQGNGFEALRVRMAKYEPRTAQTKRAYFKNIVSNRQAKNVEDMSAMIQTPERNIKGYEDVAGKPLDEDLRVIALTDGCAPELRHKLELELREVSYRELGATW